MGNPVTKLGNADRVPAGFGVFFVVLLVTRGFSFMFIFFVFFSLLSCAGSLFTTPIRKMFISD